MPRQAVAINGQPRCPQPQDPDVNQQVHEPLVHSQVLDRLHDFALRYMNSRRCTLPAGSATSPQAGSALLQLREDWAADLGAASVSSTQGLIRRR